MLDMLLNALLIVGMASVGFLWVFCMVAVMHSLWDIFGDSILGVIDKLQGLKR